jgi:hypothetical protein
MIRIAVYLSAFLAAAGLAALCHAETSPAQGQKSDLSQPKQVAERLDKKQNEQQRHIEELQNRADADDRSLDIRGGQAETAQPQDQPPSVKPDQKEKEAVRKKSGQTKDEAQTQPVGRPPEKPPARQQYKEIEAIFREQGVLTPRGTLIVEPSFQYAFSSSTRVVLNGYTIIPTITVGLIDVRSVNRNTYIPALTARYGLTGRLEVNTYVPYVFRSDSASAAAVQGQTNERVFNASGNNIGDIQFGMRYQFNMPMGGGPIFIGGLLAKSNTGKDPFNVPIDPSTGLETQLATGTGFWAIQPSVSIIFPSDPVVFFGSVNYLYNFGSNKRVTTVDISTNTTTVTTMKIVPGDTIGFNFGMGFAMNERTSFSFGYEHYIIGKTKVNGSIPATAQITTLGSLLFGASYKLSDRVNLNFSLEAGITESAPDVQLTLRVPFSI